MSQSRNWNIDLTKSLAMILVVMQHAWSMLGLDDSSWGLVCSSYKSISTLGVTLFIFVSGALLLSHKSESESLFSFYIKRFRRLLIPFVFLAAVAYIASLFSGTYEWWDGSLQMALIQFIPALLENQINEFHWFVHMLFVLYLFTPILQRALNALKQQDVEFLLLIWLIGMLLKQYYPAMMFSRYLPPLWIHLGIYVAGYYVYNYCKGGKFLKVGVIIFILLCILNISTNCAIDATRHLATIFLGMMCLNISFKDDVQQSIFGKVTINISRYSYTTYLLHILFIRVIYMLTESYFSSALIVWIPLLITPFVVLVFYVGCRKYDTIKWLPNNLVGIG